MLVNLLGDDTVLPKEGKGSLQYNIQCGLRAVVPHRIADQADPLSPIQNNKIQDAERLLKAPLGKDFTGGTRALGDGNSEDTVTILQGKNGYEYYQLDLAHAGHAYPSLNQDVQTSSAKSYPYALSTFFAKMFEVEQISQRS